MTQACIYFGDNLPILQSMPGSSVDLIYIDPPFNTGRTQSRTRIRTLRSEKGDRKGFMGHHYQTVKLGSSGYADIFDDFLEFISPRLEEAHRLLKANGSLYFHIDYREAHYCKIALDAIFGRSCFLNEIIWAYDFGARTKNRWPPKHDTIFWYAKDSKNYIFNYEEIERIPYMSPGLVGPEKAALGKTPTDTWWHSIVGTNSHERTGYPTQKPEAILRRIIQASSNEGDTVLDFFAGSGTTGAVCHALSRNFILVDNNPAALKVMAVRFKNYPAVEWINYDPTT
jgi:site-specific DNA-methyltransferase (adenine-specific)